MRASMTSGLSGIVADLVNKWIRQIDNLALFPHATFLFERLDPCVQAFQRLPDCGGNFVDTFERFGDGRIDKAYPILRLLRGPPTLLTFRAPLFAPVGFALLLALPEIVAVALLASRHRQRVGRRAVVVCFCYLDARKRD